MYWPLVLLFLFSYCNLVKADSEIENIFTLSDPESKLTTKDFILKYGYAFEEHVIRFPDGGISVIHRIPGRLSSVSNVRRIPIFMFHPIATSSIIWVFNTKERSLAFLLVDNGYDLWMANIRGNSYSIEYSKTLEKTEKFWDFSFQEVGQVDAPIMIDYILNKTGHEKLFYLGMSMGSTAGFVMLSTKPEYNNKIYAFIALSPVAYLKHSTSPLFFLFYPIHFLQNLIGRGGSLPTTFLKPLKTFILENCRKLKLCFFSFKIVLYLIGDEYEQYNMSRANVFLNSFPDTMSFKMLEHYYQWHKSGEFRMYDYGNPKDNFIVYNQSIPSVFNISKITVPVALLSAIDDSLSTNKDIQMLAMQIPNLIFNAPILTGKGCGHLSPIISKSAYDNVFPIIVKILKSYANK